MWRRASREDPEEAGVVDEWESGWQRHGLSPAAAGLLTRVVRWGALAVLASGPVLGVGALLHSSDSAAAEGPQQQRQTVTPQRASDTAGPAGFAELFLDAYLTAHAGQEQRLAPFYPDAASEDAVRLPQKAETSHVERVAAVRVAESGSGVRSVTVAARLKGQDGLRYFQVPVAKSGSGGGYVASALPAEVAAPNSGGSAPELGYGKAAPAREGDPMAGTLRGFFGAYLTGSGQLDRFLSPGTRMTAVSPAPYTQVRVAQVAMAGTDDADDGSESGRPPADGQRKQLLVDVEAKSSRAGGQWRPMTYALELSGRDGRWEVAALQPAPQHKPAGQGGQR